MNAYAQAFSSGLKPDPNLTVSEWSDTYRILPSKGAAEPGRYRTARAPFLKEIMDCLSPHTPIQRIVFMKSSQVGGTELGLNWLGAIIHLWPAPVMILQPNLELAERFSKQRVEPMLDETPQLRKLIAPSRQRDSGNSILLKQFRGGVLVMAGSNSGVSLRQMPVRFLFADEISGYHADADGEGDPVSLAEKRTQTFGVRKKIFLNSTPKEKETCRIESEYLRTDQRRYFVPCPHCGVMQYLKWPQIKWTDGDHRTAKYECEHCKELIEEYHKTKMLAAGEWIPTAPGDPEVRGYHINALYSPLGWKSWAECVKEFLDAVEKQRSGDANLLKAFVNSCLAETWEDKFAAKIGAEGLRARAEIYEPGIVPSKVLVLTAGVDVQDDRLEVSIYGWGRGEECWLVSHSIVFGDPAQAEIWKQLDDILLRPWRRETGDGMKIAASSIDSGGHFTHEVYQYARARKANRVLAVKGQSQKGKPAIGKPTKQDVNFRGQVLKHGVELYPIGADTIKTTIYARYKLEVHGPGFVHFHAALPDEFFEQITAEKKVTKFNRGGFAVSEWVKLPGKRNEALDCAVYAYAAMQWLYTKYHRKTIWDQFAKMLGVKPEPEITSQQDTPSQVNTTETEQPKLQSDRPARRMDRNRRGGFVSRW